MSVPGAASAAPAAVGRHRLQRFPGFLLLLLTATLFLAFDPCSSAQAASSQTNKPAVVKVSGFGLFGNREMLRVLRSFQSNQRFPPALGRAFVEDAALVLLSRMNQEGYLSASLQTRFTMVDGTKQVFQWTNVLDTQLPREFEARRGRFRVRGGPRSYYQSVQFEGAKAIPPREAERYFIGGDTLLNLRATRVYTPSRLKSSMAALQEALRRKGYRDAFISAHDLEVNRENGAVRVKIVVEEGLQSLVREVALEIHEKEQPTQLRTLRPKEPYSVLWQQELSLRLREEQYRRGYPDAAIELKVVRRQTNEAAIYLDFTARVETGPSVHLGKVSFEGQRDTRISALQRLVRLDEGSLLDRVEVEQSRQRLARVGVFDWVSLRYERTNETVRDAVFELKEGKPVSLSVLAGYGSYELLRGGLEFEHRNVLGLAHDVRLRALQSFKSSSGDMIYTVPEFLFEHVNLFGRGSGLRREEVSFTRLEYGGAIGLQKRLAPIQTDLAVRYDYEFLNALDLAAPTNQLGVTDARAAAIVIDLNRDRLDNPLAPRRGLKLFSNIELAAAALGGNVNYQRIVLGASFHQNLGGGRLLHLGLAQGVTFTAGGEDEELPFNKRFFPGGENSIRGYQQGEASPLDANGEQVGAETYTQANIEFEQFLTQLWSLVAFFDAVGVARSRSDYPWDEGLYSAGGGISWRTIIGPARLEYGYNLNRRPHDPVGTLHLSIGFPF
jgi:outer membrane protein insertion porin family